MPATFAERKQRRRPPFLAVVLQKPVAGHKGATGAERDHEAVQHPVRDTPEPAGRLGPAGKAPRNSAVLWVLLKEILVSTLSYVKVQ